MNILSVTKVFGGSLKRIKHQSLVNNCEMTFSIFMPSCSTKKSVPVLYWLSGLTCTDENFCQKSGAFLFAEKYNLAIVCPDTSPRNINIPHDNDSYDLGSGAGFYVNATQSPWADHYQMNRYITEELPDYIAKNFNVTDTISISGHSMGGHGAIICGLQNPNLYQSISAFAPILNPSKCPWGIKAFTHYLGEDKKQWQQYDATELIQQTTNTKPILIDQGSSDEYLETQLMPNKFITLAKDNNSTLTYRLQPEYDHSYYFISTFIADHIEFHANHLN